MRYDLLVVGAGTAGMPCAIEAARRGRRVLVLEKDARVGGTLHLTGGHLSAGGTRQQALKGIADSAQAHADDVMRISFNTADDALVRLATAEAPHTLDWLDELGFDFAPESPRLVYGHVPYQTPRTHHGVEAGQSILRVLMPLWEQTLAGGNLICLTGHALTGLLIEGNRVVGVTARHGEEETEFHADAVVLTTGGYGGNPAYFAEKHPDLPPLKSTANPLCRGEGIAVAERSGAATWGFDKHIGSLGGVELQPGSGVVDFWTAWAMVLTSVYRKTREIYVNAAGQRFMNEDEVNADTRERLVARQPGQHFFILFDETALAVDGPTIMLNWDAARIRAEAERSKAGPRSAIVRADSLAELAQKTGLPADELASTVARFNGFVARQNDEEFGRTTLANGLQTPPFYAIESHVSVILTFGGIRVNGNLQVLNTENRVIENLYAAGEVIGMAATSGNAFCSGMAVTPALSFGRILGRRL